MMIVVRERASSAGRRQGIELRESEDISNEGNASDIHGRKPSQIDLPIRDCKRWEEGNSASSDATRHVTWNPNEIKRLDFYVSIRAFRGSND